MIPLSTTPEKDVKNFLWGWLQLLAERRFDDAWQQIDLPDPAGFWSGERIKLFVDETYHPQTIFYLEFPEGPVFTSPYELPEKENSTDIWEWDDKEGVSAAQALCLNHEWSQLTAFFEFKKAPDGYAAMLTDMYVP
jgi:hypothetical protein